MSSLRPSKTFAAFSAVARFSVREQRSFVGSRVKTRLGLVLRKQLFVVKVTASSRSKRIYATLFCWGMDTDSLASHIESVCESILSVKLYRGHWWLKRLKPLSKNASSSPV